MRVSPSAAISGQMWFSDQYLTDPTTGSPTISLQGNIPTGGRAIIGGFSGLTVGRYYSSPGVNAGNGFIEFSAEL